MYTLYLCPIIPSMDTSEIFIFLYKTSVSIQISLCACSLTLGIWFDLYCCIQFYCFIIMPVIFHCLYKIWPQFLPGCSATMIKQCLYRKDNNKNHGFSNFFFTYRYIPKLYIYSV